MLLFGGASGDAVLGDTWTWDGAGWAGYLTAPQPEARRDAALAYDGARGRAVLFGGEGDSGYLDDTWEWDAQSWEQVSSGFDDGPTARARHAMAYDDGLEAVVLFGGSRAEQTAGEEVLADTWLFAGGAWEPGSFQDQPPPRAGHAMVYDEATGEVLLFGGEDGEGEALGDTWVRSDEGWLDVSPQVAESPPPRRDHALAYDPIRERVVLFGGVGQGALYADTWEWDGAARAWTEIELIEAAPAPREGHALAFDSATERVILFGGLGESGEPESGTLAWDGSQWEPATGEDASGPARTGHALTGGPRT